MTIRIYYDDPNLVTFDATVTRVEPRETVSAVWLDRTAFYPTSGGQPFDTGSLGGRPVVDVQDDEAGGVVHLTAGPPPEAGQAIRGDVDWPRRLDHMQQHTGQHVLSAVIERAFKARTVSFHLGTGSSTIDIDREISASDIAEAERAANEVIWRNLPVTVRYVTEDEARALPLRKEPVRTGTLRLIDIEGVDLSACGGTHVARTGTIGQIAVGSWERFKGGQRLEFLCGRRALVRSRQLRDISAAAIRLLSVLPDELPAAIDRVQGELKDQKRLLAAAQLELAKYEAAAMADGAATTSFGGAVFQAVDGDAVRLKALASAIVVRPGLLAVLVTTSAPALAVAARSNDVPVSCQEIVAALTKAFGGRGGGKPDLAQCGGLQAPADQILATAREVLAQTI
jgi:alanyl-tRNA synthetase